MGNKLIGLFSSDGYAHHSGATDSEYTLCGMALEGGVGSSIYDKEDSWEFSSFIPKETSFIDCPACVRIIKHCQDVPTSNRYDHHGLFSSLSEGESS